MLQSNTVDYMLQQSDVISGPGNAVRCVVKSERCRGRVSLSLSLSLPVSPWTVSADSAAILYWQPPAWPGINRERETSQPAQLSPSARSLMSEAGNSVDISVLTLLSAPCPGRTHSRASETCLEGSSAQ